MRLVKILLAILLAALWAAPHAGAYSLVLQDGRKMQIHQFLMVGERIEGTILNGGAFAIQADAVDFQSTYVENLEESKEKGIYLSRGKVITFEEIEIKGDAAILVLSDQGEITVPLQALDFRTTVIEDRGAQRAGSSLATARRTTSRSARAPASPKPPPSRRRPSPGTIAPVSASLPPDGGAPAEDGDDERGSFGDAFHGGDEPETARSRQPTRRITRAEVVQKVDPVFDQELVPEGRGLTALMEVTVTTAGTVGNVKVIKSTGNPELDAAGVESIHQYIYNPAEKDGVPFESRRLERISFRKPQ